MPTPTAAASTKPTSVAPRLNIPNTNAPTAARYRIRAVASFTRLSPSRIVTTRRGTPSRPTTATADTASGGDTIAPSREVGCRPKHRRQEHEEYKVRLDTQAGKARHQAHEETHKDKQHWIRNRKPSGSGHAEKNTSKNQKDYLKRCGCHDSDCTPLSDEIGDRVIMFFQE